MLVLIDTKSLTVKIYTENGIKSIPFEEVDLLKDMLKNKKVIYVTNAMVATASSIIQTVKTLQQQRSNELQKAGEPMFLRSTLPGPLNIPNIRNKNTGQKEAIIFQGPFDGLLVDDLISDFGEELFKRNKEIRGLLKKGRLQVLGESEFEDQKARFERGELPMKNVADDYKKYLKLLSKQESEAEVAFEVGAISARPSASSRDNNETAPLEGLSTEANFMNGIDRLIGR